MVKSETKLQMTGNYKNEEGSIFIFRELTDDSSFFKNKSFDIRLLRFTIRVIQNVLPFRSSKFILVKIAYIISKFNQQSHLLYILNLNIFRLRYLSNISKNNFSKAMELKKEWAEFILEKSSCGNNISAAKSFLNMVENETFTDLNNVKDHIKGIANKNFYISGPSFGGYKSINFKEYTLVHLKPFSSDLSAFNHKILFLNSYFYRKKVINDPKLQQEILGSYDNIYIFCSVSKMLNGFKRLAGLPQGDIASPMGLNRVLGYLIASSTPSSEFVIDGFDLFLSKNSYKNKKYSKNANHLPSERNICLSLTHHDAAYNFLYTKKLVNKIILRNSLAFKSIADLSVKNYIKKLVKNRDFTLISN